MAWMACFNEVAPPKKNIENAVLYSTSCHWNVGVFDLLGGCCNPMLAQLSRQSESITFSNQQTDGSFRRKQTHLNATGKQEYGPKVLPKNSQKNTHQMWM